MHEQTLHIRITRRPQSYLFRVRRQQKRHSRPRGIHQSLRKVRFRPLRSGPSNQSRRCERRRRNRVLRIHQCLFRIRPDQPLRRLGGDIRHDRQRWQWPDGQRRVQEILHLAEHSLGFE